MFLFNVVGYKLFFYYLEIEADERIQSKIEQISENDKALITIKIPINLPYHTDWANFERVDGEVNIKGKIYKYVKQKIHRDTLILLCINDTEKTEIHQQKDNYVKKVNNLASDSHKKPSPKQAKTDYFESLVAINFATFSVDKGDFYTSKNYNYPLGFSLKIETPPKHS